MGELTEHIFKRKLFIEESLIPLLIGAALLIVAMLPWLNWVYDWTISSPIYFIFSFIIFSLGTAWFTGASLGEPLLEEGIKETMSDSGTFLKVTLTGYLLLVIFPVLLLSGITSTIQELMRIINSLFG